MVTERGMGSGWFDLEPARDVAALPAAAESWRVTYSGTSVSGERVPMTGLVHLPRGRVPPGGWPVVTYGHMTTAVCGRGAPSLATSGHPERRRMTQGDALCSRLLSAGRVVLRPDYEGMSGRGPHPYLIGRSLGQSTLDLLAAARAADERIGGDWVSIGHSEGATAAAYAAWLASADGSGGGARLAGLALVAPVTRLDLTIGAALRAPVVVPGMEVVTPLIAMMIVGVACVDARVAELVGGAGLSRRARERWNDLATMSLEELRAPASLGGLAPRDLLGPAGDELQELLLAGLRSQELADLALPIEVPVRVDSAMFDEVAPAPLTTALVRRWRAGGVRVEHRRWRASHSTVLAAHRAPAPLAAWVIGS